MYVEMNIFIVFPYFVIIILFTLSLFCSFPSSDVHEFMIPFIVFQMKK